MNSKIKLRKQLEAGMAVFLSQGNVITKAPMKGTKKPKQPKEEIVEIEVDHLPKALQQKYFAQ